MLQNNPVGQRDKCGQEYSPATLARGWWLLDVALVYMVVLHIFLFLYKPEIFPNKKFKTLKKQQQSTHLYLKFISWTLGFIKSLLWLLFSLEWACIFVNNISRLQMVTIGRFRKAEGGNILMCFNFFFLYQRTICLVVGFLFRTFDDTLLVSGIKIYLLFTM